MSDWTQAVCDDCFKELFPTKTEERTYRIVEEKREEEKCCQCGTIVKNGLYIRINPTTVPYPTLEKKS